MVSFSIGPTLYSTPGLSAIISASILDGIIFPSWIFAPGTVIWDFNRNIFPSGVSNLVVATSCCDLELYALKIVILPSALTETWDFPEAGKSGVADLTGLNICAFKALAVESMEAVTIEVSCQGVFLKRRLMSARAKIAVPAKNIPASTAIPPKIYKVFLWFRFRGAGSYASSKRRTSSSTPASGASLDVTSK